MGVLHVADMSRRCARRGCSNSFESRNTARNTANCAALTLRLKQVEFALTDVTLYLDAYPQCSEALAYYHRLREERNSLVEAINSQCGPLTILDNVNTNTWQWIDGPWPWMIDAN